MSASDWRQEAFPSEVALVEFFEGGLARLEDEISDSPVLMERVKAGLPLCGCDPRPIVRAVREEQRDSRARRDAQRMGSELLACAEASQVPAERMWEFGWNYMDEFMRHCIRPFVFTPASFQEKRCDN